VQRVEEQAIGEATVPPAHWRPWLIFSLGLALSAGAIYTAGFGVFEEVFLRSGTVGLSVLLMILAQPLRLGGGIGRLLGPILDAGLFAATVVAIYWYFSLFEELETGLYDFTKADLWIAWLGLAVLLELTRRVFGLPLFIVCVLAIVYCLSGEQLPWILQHAGFSAEQTLRTLWYSFDGVFGRPVAVVTGFILVFIVFGVMLDGVGAGRSLLKIAFSLTGGLRGGPGHAAVVASAMFGTMSGSVAANVVGTGVFTIPMIKRRGLPAKFAGAIEAAASSGGQFMPPVMGAVAFIMADVTGIPYLTICVAALVPACFYYASLFCAVSVEAVKKGIQPIPRAEREVITRHDWLMSLGFLVPLAVIIGLLVSGRSAALAGFWATVTAAAIGLMLNPDLRRRPWHLITTLGKAGKSCATIMIAVAAVGIVIGAMNQTGLGLRFAALILSFADNSLIIALLLMMGGCLVLGMGMPTVPAYLIIVLVMGPAIEKLGVPTLIVHLFVVYYGVLSSITPPVAIAAYAAAPICGANPMATAVEAVRVALVGFIIPFVLVYNPSLSLVEGFNWPDFIWIAARLSLAIWLVATGLSGFERRRLPIWSRSLRLAAAAAMLLPIAGLSIGGFLAGAGLLAAARMAHLRAGRSAA
jgi:TRAP transporter 4TM/12TM fusion protein